MPIGSSVRAHATLAFAAAVGVACGVAAWAFLALLGAATSCRDAHAAVVFALPAAGLVLGAAYERFGAASRGGTNLVLSASRAGGPAVPGAMAPLVLLGTVLTHLFGGSAGREGTAVQMGAGIADALARVAKVDAGVRRALVHAGIAGGFGAVFGTPLAGAVFALEAPARRRPHLAAAAPALVAAFVGDRVAHALGVVHAPFPRVEPVGFSWPHAARLAVVALAVAAVAATFVEALRASKALAERALPRLPLRMAAGGAAVVFLWQLTGATAHLGLSVPLAQRAFSDPALSPAAFVTKALFTVVTLAGGFVGGEVTPMFVVGATLGNVLARVTGLPLDLGAGIGLAALFGAAAKAPVALAVMAGELLGWAVFPHALAVALLAAELTGPRSLYPSALD